MIQSDTFPKLIDLPHLVFGGFFGLILSVLAEIQFAPTLVLIIATALLAVCRARANDMSGALLLASAPAVFALAVSTTIFGRGIDSNFLSVLLVFGAIAGGVHALFGIRAVRSREERPKSPIPVIYSSLVLLFFTLRLRLVDDGGSRWWLLTQISEDNAAWLNMSNQVSNLDGIAPSVTRNLGHSLPFALWFLSKFTGLISEPRHSGTLSPLISDDVMLVLRLNVLLIAFGALLSASLVEAALEIGPSRNHRLVHMFAAAPAVVGSVLCGMVLSRFGYLSAHLALVLFQAVLLVVIRQRSTRHLFLIPCGLLVLGLAWFPMIPISTLGLVVFLVVQWRRSSIVSMRRKMLGTLVVIACITVQVGHLTQLLRRYPDVDRAQRSMWIASSNMMPLFLALLFVGILIFHSTFEVEARVSGTLALSVPSGWLCVVWLNDLIRTGGPAHYGTTKLSLILIYGLLPLLIALAILGALKFSNENAKIAVASAAAISLTLSILSLSNDANGRWPRKPSTEELGQNTTLGLIPSFETARLQNPSQVACLFVGDFKATGTWQGSYACNRWGASALGLDGPLNEAFRHLLLGHPESDKKIAQLMNSEFFRDIVIISDQPMKLVELDPWNIFNSVRDGAFVIPSENSRVVSFRTIAERP